MRAQGALLITAPTEAERVYEMGVQIEQPELRTLAQETVLPWVRLRANTDTGDVTVACGMKVRRPCA